jgi:hypothetical protein
MDADEDATSRSHVDAPKVIDGEVTLRDECPMSYPSCGHSMANLHGVELGKPTHAVVLHTIVLGRRLM